MSCQPRPHPQASGTAAATARRGMVTKTPTRNWSRRPVGSGSISGIGTRLVTGGSWVVAVPGGKVVSGGAVIVNLALLSAGAGEHGLCGWVTRRAPRETVADLRAPQRLRNRNLRNRRLYTGAGKTSPSRGAEHTHPLR